MMITAGPEHRITFPGPRFFHVCMISLGLAFTVANAQFIVQPMVISRTMAPGDSSKLTLSLENRGPDHIQVRAETVDLAKDKDGHWVLIDTETQDVAELVIVESCRHWLGLGKAKTDLIEIEPEGSPPLDLEICVPAAAQGSYQAAVKIMLASTTDTGVRVRYVFVVPVMLEIKRTKQDQPEKDLTFDSLSAIDLLDKYAAHQDKLFSSFAYKSVVNMSFEAVFEQGSKHSEWKQMPVEARWDGERFWIGKKSSFYNLKNDPNVPLDGSIWQRFTVWDGKQCMSYHEYPNRVEPSDGFISNYEHPNTTRGVFYTEFWGSPFFGIMLDCSYDDINTMMRKFEAVSVRGKLEPLGSDLCYVIDAKTPSSSITVWLNAAAGYSIMQAEAHLAGTDMIGHDLKPQAEGLRQSVVVKVLEFKQINDVYVPMEYTLTGERNEGYPTGSPLGDQIGSKRKIREKIVDIALNPDHDALGSFVVPKMRNGTKFCNWDDGANYVLKDGKLISPEGWIFNLDKLASGRGGMYGVRTSLIGKPLPGRGGINIGQDLKSLKGKRLLLCFWDFSQRPSRHLLEQLSKQASSFREQDIAVIAVQTSKVDQTKLGEWIKERCIPFLFRSLTGEQKAVFGQWSVRGLPWLILTNADHEVTHEGLTIADLDAELLQ
jgi:hypothetical protein